MRFGAGPGAAGYLPSSMPRAAAPSPAGGLGGGSHSAGAPWAHECRRAQPSRRSGRIFHQTRWCRPWPDSGQTGTVRARGRATPVIEAFPAVAVAGLAQGRRTPQDRPLRGAQATERSAARFRGGDARRARERHGVAVPAAWHANSVPIAGPEFTAGLAAGAARTAVVPVWQENPAAADTMNGSRRSAAAWFHDRRASAALAGAGRAGG